MLVLNDDRIMWCAIQEDIGHLHRPGYLGGRAQGRDASHLSVPARSRVHHEMGRRGRCEPFVLFATQSVVIVGRLFFSLAQVTRAPFPRKWSWTRPSASTTSTRIRRSPSTVDALLLPLDGSVSLHPLCFVCLFFDRWPVFPSVPVAPGLPCQGEDKSIYRRGARRWRKLYRVNGHLFQAKRFNRVRFFALEKKQSKTWSILLRTKKGQLLKALKAGNE